MCLSSGAGRGSGCARVCVYFISVLKQEMLANFFWRFFAFRSTSKRKCGALDGFIDDRIDGKPIEQATASQTVFLYEFLSRKCSRIFCLTFFRVSEHFEA